MILYEVDTYAYQGACERKHVTHYTEAEFAARDILYRSRSIKGKLLILAYAEALHNEYGKRKVALTVEAISSALMERSGVLLVHYRYAGEKSKKAVARLWAKRTYTDFHVYSPPQTSRKSWRLF